ncbi:hypothetical protein ACFPRL_08900 [Pseudoclavibacter helvolus]
MSPSWRMPTSAVTRLTLASSSWICALSLPARRSWLLETQTSLLSSSISAAGKPSWSKAKRRGVPMSKASTSVIASCRRPREVGDVPRMLPHPRQNSSAPRPERTKLHCARGLDTSATGRAPRSPLD